jgi:hypothetical protein
VDNGRIGIWLYRAAAAVVFAFAAACSLHMVGNFWQWGHNGYNGAAFSQAARNSLRFGIVGQAQYHTGLEPPPESAIYTHHPMMLHLHLVALLGMLGDDEWVGRLVPTAYTLLNLLMVFVIARRLGGPALGLLSAALFAVLPINLIFANMINHEQGGIFWCLVTVWAWTMWVRGGRWRYLLAACTAVTIATQFDWPGYYVAFFVAVHAVVLGWTRHRGMLRWRPEHTWIAVFSAVVLVNFAGFFLWIRLSQGSLDGMRDSFAARTSSPPGYWRWLLVQIKDMYGAVPLALLAGWVATSAAGLRRGALQLVDVVALMFLLAQAIHSTVFQQAGMFHSYWTYWLAPAVAIGGARFLVVATDALAAGGRRVVLAAARPRGTVEKARMARRALWAAPLAAILGGQGWYALEQLRWGHDTGSAAYQTIYDDHFAEVTWARRLARRYPRQRVHYMMDGSVRGRIELLYYLDSPHSRVDLEDVRRSRRHARKQRVVLADLRHVTARAALARLVRVHPTRVWDRRFVAVELGRWGGSVEGRVSVAQPMSWWWRWLVNPWRPPLEHVPDPSPEAVEGLFATDVDVSAVPVRGRPGGTRRTWDCPGGQVMGALSVVVRDHPSLGTVLGAFRPFCRPVLEDQKTAGGRPILPWGGPWMGGWWGVREEHVGCDRGEVPVGLEVHLARNGVVKGLALLCAAVRRGPGKEPVLDELIRVGETAGGGGGQPVRAACPAGSVVWGFRGRVGELLDQTGVACVVLDRAFVDNPPTPSGRTPWKWP